jgi:hypothetical protein
MRESDSNAMNTTGPVEWIGTSLKVDQKRDTRVRRCKGVLLPAFKFRDLFLRDWIEARVVKSTTVNGCNSGEYAVSA